MWPDKSIHFIEGYGIVSRNGEEEAVRMIGVNIDITKRKKTEENLFQSNERFEKVTEATNDAIWDWDMVNKTFYRSKAFERFFGKDATGTFPDSDLWSRDRFHPEDFTKIQKSINEAITNPLTTRGELEYRLLNKNEEIHYVINRAVIIRDSEGNAIRMVGAMTDISEQKQMTLQLSELNQSLQQHTLELERSNEELEQFAFVASHDLQEPLRMISSFMELLKRKYGDNIDEKGHQYIHFATDGAKRMKQIILDLLDYSRAGKISEEKEVVSLDEVVSEFKQLRRKLISEKNATITASELPTLNIKRAVITQILHCLLDNALKYSLEDIAPIIEIDVAENESEWVFAVKDKWDRDRFSIS
jgi:PAS domain S-box-containing protein